LRPAALLPILVWTLSGAGLSAAAPPPERITLEPPAPPGAFGPALAAESSQLVVGTQELLLTWLEPSAAGATLRFARYSGKTWTAPVTLAENLEGLEPDDEPTLSVIETQGVRRTLLARAGDALFRSGDAGRTWSRLPGPPLPYSSFAPGEEGAWAFWPRRREDGKAALFATRVLAGETLVAESVAPGFGTAATMTWDGPIVVYRAASGAGDLAVIRRREARWIEPGPVHLEGSAARAGSPRVAAHRRQVAVAWVRTDPRGSSLEVAFSADAGRTFGSAVEAVEPEHGPVSPNALDLVLDDDGQALILWTAAGDGDGDDLWLARVAPDGRRGPSFAVGRGLAGAAQPRLARAGTRLAVAWLEGAPFRLRLETVPLEQIPPVATTPPEAAPAATAAAASGRGRVGELAPDAAVLTLAGESTTLAALRGRPVLLNLWATWCLPCLAEMPELAAFHERFGKEGLVVLGLSVDAADLETRVRAMVIDRKVPFTVWRDPNNLLYRALRVQTLPTSLLIDREGRILLRRDRAITAGDAELEAAIARALAPPS
jgi:thiol-disulfide isomerase/thioredoxin